MNQIFIFINAMQLSFLNLRITATKSITYIPTSYFCQFSFNVVSVEYSC